MTTLITVLGKEVAPPVRAGPSPGGTHSATGLPGYESAGPAPISQDDGARASVRNQREVEDPGCEPPRVASEAACLREIAVRGVVEVHLITVSDHVSLAWGVYAAEGQIRNGPRRPSERELEEAVRRGWVRWAALSHVRDSLPRQVPVAPQLGGHRATWRRRRRRSRT